MAFTSTKVFNVSPRRILGMAHALENELQKDGYDTRSDMLFGGDVVVSITKGGMFKAIIGMKTALKVELRADGENVSVKTSVGIWGYQIVPTVIMFMVFWPVLLTQIWGLVLQSKLDARVMEILAKAVDSKDCATINVSEEGFAPARFCSECGKPVSGNFCTACGMNM